MGFYPCSQNGDVPTGEHVQLGLEYNDANLRVQGLFFQGAITRELTAQVWVRYNLGAGPEELTYGPFNAKNQQTGSIVNMTGLGLFMREVTLDPDQPSGDDEDPPIPPGTTEILPPLELLSFSVEWL